MQDQLKKAKALTALLLIGMVTAGFSQSPRPGASARGRRPAPAKSHPTRDEILAKYTGAIEGKQSYQKLKSRVSRGIVTSARLKSKGTIEFYQKAPSKQLTAISFPGIGRYRNGFNGAVAWMQGGDTVQEVQDFEKRDADFYLALKLRELYPQLKFTGTDRIRHHVVYVLEAPSEGQQKQWFFDRETGLLLRTQKRSAEGRISETVDLGDYRDVDGVRLPFSSRSIGEDGVETWRVQLSEVKHNVPLDDALFEMPSGLSIGAQVVLEVPHAPTPVSGKGETHLAYELHVTNFGTSDLTLTRVEIFDNERKTSPLASYQDSELTNRLYRLGDTSKLPDQRSIKGGMRAVIYLWLTFSTSSQVPGSLGHRLTFELTKSAGKKDQNVVEGGQININKEAALVIGAPLGGGPWVAFSGPSNDSFHRRSLITLGGKVRVPQRFAIDWAKLGGDGTLLRGDGSKNADYYSYGAEILAVADAVVSELKDGIPENVPLPGKRAVPMTLENAVGNYIILDLGHDCYALYAHLQPGSLRIQVGQRVRRGQVIALLGNSGNSTGPHLHFQVSDANSPLGGEGSPYVIERFEVLDVLQSGELDSGKAWRPPLKAPVENREKEIPMGNTVIRFP